MSDKNSGESADFCARAILSFVTTTFPPGPVMTAEIDTVHSNYSVKLRRVKLRRDNQTGYEKKEDLMARDDYQISFRFMSNIVLITKIRVGGSFPRRRK